MKKIFPIFLMLAVSVIQAATYAAITSGPYVSIGVGNLMHNDKLTISNWSNGYTFFKAPDNGNAAGLIFLAGYQTLRNNFILNADAVYRLFPGQPSACVSLNAINTPCVTTTTTLGVELRPGYLIVSQASMYAIIGFEDTYYKLTYSFNQGNAKIQGWQPGLGLGIGSDIALTDILALQLTYLYINYKDLNYSDKVSKTNVKLNPSANIFSLALSYRLA